LLPPWLISNGRSCTKADVGDIAPSPKATVTGSTVIVGGQELATKLEEVVDRAKAGEVPLGMPRRLEAMHLPFSSPRRLMRDLGPVVSERLVCPLLLIGPGRRSWSRRWTRLSIVIAGHSVAGIDAA
jgi:hypothetical protein